MAYSMHRPTGSKGQGDSHLPRIVGRLRRALAKTQRELAFDTLRLSAVELHELTGILVDFAEDLHNDNGLWKAYERYNTEFFGAPLPLTSEETGSLPPGLPPDRFCHFLWILYPMLIDGLILSPAHRDLRHIADECSAVLSDAFSTVPRESGVRRFLRTPNDYGWDVKRKLIWLGAHSFLFRLSFARYMEKQGAELSDIGHTDDFLCQECARWSGLGAIDILAEVLDVSDEDRSGVRNWYERHAAFYRLVSVNDNELQAINVVNDQPYRIRISMPRNPFRAGQLVFGSLVPWRGDWYWSGEQRLLGDAAKIDLLDMKMTMQRHNPGIVCRYSKEFEAKTRQFMSDLNHKTLAFHKDKDLVVYSDGLSMAADWQKELRWHWDSRPKKEVEKVIEKHGRKKGRPNINLPSDLLEEKDGLGVFLNPEEGKEIMPQFRLLIAGLKKRGEGVADDEFVVIRQFIESQAVSPRFVRRVLEEHGDESVKAVFLLKDNPSDYWLDYLLRSRKGQFYRRRYPSLAIA
jgi:hypothetical protein